MALPQVPPGGGGRKSHVHFGYVNTGFGKNWHAYMAGPVHWFACHAKGKTKACVSVMTGGELHCERCAAGQPTEETGYVPLYRELDSKPTMVIVHEYTREATDALKLHQRVIVGRGEDVADGVYVVPALKPEPRFQTTLKERMVAADLTETLLRVWGIPELVEWYRQTHGHQVAPAAPPAKPPAPPPKRSDGLPFSPMTRAAAERADGPMSEDVGEAINRVGKRLLAVKPSTNGHHKTE